jgi:hypothetical protein
MTAELGIAGSCLVLLALVVYLAKTIKLWLGRRDTFAVGIGAGVIAGAVSIGVHSFLDFNMHIPANPMALSSVLAIGFVSMHIERHSTYDKFFYKTRSVPVNGKGPLILLATLVLVVSSFLFQRVTGHFMAEVNCATVQNSTLNRDKKPPLWEIKRAIDYDPANAQYYDKLARHYMRLPIESKDLKSKINEEVITNLEKAISLNPANGLYWYDLGLRYSYKGYAGDEYLTKWLPMADAAFERAIHLRPHDAYLLHNTGRYWVWRSSTLLEAEGSLMESPVGGPQSGIPQGKQSSKAVVSSQWSREQGIDKFQGLFRRSLEIEKKHWEKAVERVWKYYPDERIVMGIVPEEDKDLAGRVKKWLGLKKQGETRREEMVDNSQKQLLTMACF